MFDAKNVDPGTLRFGPNHVSPYIRAAAIDSNLGDINNDGRLDMVVTFSVYAVTSSAPSQVDCFYDLWLWGETLNGEIFVAKDYVNVVLP